MKRLFVLGLAGVIGSALSLSCTPKTPTYTIKYAEKRSSLKNGLRVVIIPDPSTPLVQVDVRYEVGSNENPPGKAGLAHLVEHMMFQHRMLGPDKPATFDLLPQLVVGFNAYTTWDKTHYWLRGRKNDLDTMMKIEAYRMGMHCKTIPEAQFEREREVVRNEIRQRTGLPSGQIPQMLLSAVYPKGHPYEQMVGGNDTQLTNITNEDVCKFLKDFYVPRRATLIVTGNVNPAQVYKKAEFYFGAIKDQKPAPRAAAVPINLSYKKVTHEIDVERSSVHVMWKLPREYSKDWSAARALIGTMTGRVAMQGDRYGFATSVSPGQFGGSLAPVFIMSIELKSYGRLDEALDFVWSAASQAHRGFESGAFSKEDKDRIKAGFVQGLEPLAARPELVANLIQFNENTKFKGNTTYIFDELSRIDALNGGSFGSFIKRTLKKSEAVVVVIKAKKGGKKGDKRSSLKFSSSAHDRQPEPAVNPRDAYKPVLYPSEPSSLVKAERYKLGNGMRVVLLPGGAMPIASMRLIFKAGAAHESESKAGLASIAAGMLRPPMRNNVAGKLGLRFGGGAGDDTTTFSMHGMNIYLEQMIKQMERVIKVGDYSQNGIESRRKYWKIGQKSKRARASRAFRQELANALYGAKHPYAANGSLTKKSIGRIGRDAAHAFRKKHFTASNATLVIAGDFDIKTAKEAISDNFGDWDSGHTDKPMKQPAKPRTAPSYIGVIGQPGPQVQVAIAYPGPTGIDSQEGPRLIVQGLLNLRMGKIRTELGSTYGTYARRATKLGPGYYVLGGGVDAPRTGESLAAMRKGIDDLRKGVGFEKDFVVARRIVMKRLLGQSTESYALAGRLANIASYNLAPDHYEKLAKRVATVSVAEVKALINSELNPTREIIVLLGTREMLVKGFEGAGIAQNVKYIEPESE